MKNEWETKKLGQLYHIGSSKRVLKSEWKSEGVPFYRGREVTKLATDGFVKNELFISEEHYGELCGKYGAPKCGDIVITAIGTIGNSWVVRPEDRFYFKDASVLWMKRASLASSEYINLWFKSHFFAEQLDRGNGATVDTLTIQKLQDLEVLLPPLFEQERIVAILDKAFEAIATARANTEKNLQNAYALFESHLQSIFTHRVDGWRDRSLASLCHEITVGHVGSMKSEYKEKGIPFLRSQNIRPFQVSMENSKFINESFHRSLKKSQLRPGDLAVVRTGYPGTAAVIPPELPDSNCSDLVIVRPDKEVNSHFLAAFFNSSFGKQLVLGKIVGAAQKHFNVTAAKEVVLHLPPISEQMKIVSMVDFLRAETQGLANVYIRKLAALEALKKSLLHQAFSGQLGKSVEPTNLIPFPVAIPSITATDLHAGILAKAFFLHEQRGNQKDFGHVKAEKIAHMVEALVGIDLARQPVKDAAGPNDYPHLKKVEHRAAMANFFSFTKQDTGAYRVAKKDGFDRLIQKTDAALGSRLEEVDQLLQLMLRMDREQAEIFATVYAAWNNLLLDGAEITDEAIVFEARENWHPDKLKIKREKFFFAIEWIKKKQVVPLGRGKKVEVKPPETKRK